MPALFPAPHRRIRSLLSPTDEELLLFCARYQYITHAQWCAAFEDEGRLRYVQRRSRELVADSYFMRLHIAQLGSKGKAPYLFTLGAKGRQHVASLGIAIPQRFRPTDATTLSPRHVAHSAAITDVLLSFDLLARHDDRIAIEDLRHERFLHEQRFKVTVPMVQPLTGDMTKRQVEVIPDAFVRVVAQVGTQGRVFPLVIEVDRDTERQVAFRDKIANLYAFGMSDAYERVYGARSLNVAFIFPPAHGDPRARLAEALDWTERELRQRHLEHEAVSFSFCARDPVTTPPAELLLGTHWLHPFSTTPHALIDLAESAEGGA